MAIENLNQLLDAVCGFLVEDRGRRFAMPPGGLGSPPIASLVTDSFPLTDGRWVLTSPTDPEIQGDAVVMSGEMESLLGLAPARLHVSFDLLDGGRPSLLVKLPPLDQPRPVSTWNLGWSYPVWAEERSVLTRLSFDAPAFWYSSIERAATDERPAVASGETFTAGELKLEGILAVLQAFPSFRLRELSGPITGKPDAPQMQLAAGPITPVPVQGLDLPLTFVAVSGPPSDTGKIQVPEPTVETYLLLSSSVKIGEAPRIPIALAFGGLGNVLDFSADLREISHYAVEELQAFVRGAPIGSYLDRVFRIGESVELTALDVFVSTSPLGLAAIRLGCGTTRPLTIVPGYIELPAVHVDFMVDDPADSPTITAVLTGTFQFLDDIFVEVSATYPGLVFTGSLDTDPPLPLERIVRKFVPGVQNFPDIRLSQLYVAADFAQKRYAFQLAVVSDWKIPIGIAQFELQQASLGLAYDATARTAFSGEITGEAVLFTHDDREVARFFADWKLPGPNFLLEGTFPEISLTDLAQTLTGGGVPNSAGLPEIALRNSLVRFRMESGSNRQLRLTGATGYQFDLATTIDAERIGQAHLAFEVRKGSDGPAGFVAGLVLEPEWKPDAVWSALGAVFDLITVRDAGLVLSSIEVEGFSLPAFDRMPYVPATIKPGVTFFSAMELTGDVFSLLRDLFGSDVELDLYAYIDPASITQSDILAHLGAPQGRNAVTFTGLDIEMKPGAGEFRLRAGARFEIFSERLTLSGAGIITIGGAPSATFAIQVLDWEHPFGIVGLKIRSFGLGVKISELGLGIGLLGDFLIGGEPDLQWEFIIGGDVVDFEAPDAFVFSLQSGARRPLHVTDLVKQYTSIDLSEVPLLNGLAFVELGFYVVADPSGWNFDGHHYDAGIGISADLTLYDYWELMLRLQVSERRGVLADGSISKPIEIAGVLKISDVSDGKGPSMHIDTSALVPQSPDVMTRLDEQLIRTQRMLPPGVTPAVTGINPFTILTAGDAATTYFAASGAVSILGLHEAFSGSITSDGFEVNFHADLANLFRADFMAAFSKSSGFEGHAHGFFDFDLEFPDGVAIDGWQLLSRGTRVRGPNARLDLDVVLMTSEQSVKFALEFNWGAFHISVWFALDAREIPGLLASAWEHIVAWIRDHLRAFFADILHNVEKWVAALKDGFIWVGQSALEIARTLYHLFGIDQIGALAQYLVEIGRLAFTSMVDALMDVLNATFEQAVQALEAAGRACAVATNEAVLYGAGPARELQESTIQ